MHRLGSTDLEISNIGLGTWAIGGGDWRYGLGPQDDTASIAVILEALEVGLNWIDTAPAYGLGHAEEIVGRALRKIPVAERPYVFTKCGVVWNEGDRKQEPRLVLRPDTVRAEVQSSLARLGLERIDLCQVHWPPENELAVLEDCWAELARMVDEGFVRAIGVSNFSTEQVRRCQAVRQVDSIQPRMSLIHRGAAADFIPFAREIGAGVLVYSPLQTGLLTDGWSPDLLRSLPLEDSRLLHPDFMSPHLELNLALRDGLRPIANRLRTSVASVAIAWVLAWPGVTAAIYGAREVNELSVATSASLLRLEDRDFAEIADAIANSGAGEGPVHPQRPERG
jgi:aryl-alcohol dehydrogenase-like predicted oxidoreductase